MQSRTLREGSVGLLILVGLGLFVGIILWLRGMFPGNRSFKVAFEFPNIAGLEVGAPVRFRGVTVGRVTATRPGTNGVEVDAAIAPATLIIPKDVTVQVSQSGLLGESAIDMIPPQQPLTTAVKGKPLETTCDKTQILCNNARLTGQTTASFDELTASAANFADTYSDPKFVAQVNALLLNSAAAAAEFTKVGREVTAFTQDARRQLAILSTTGQSITATSNQFGLTATEINRLLTTNRATLVSTLDNLNAASNQLRSTLNSFNQVADRAAQGEILNNLETLSANAAKASANLRDASQALNNPTTIVTLQQTLDSARATFQNTQKITADLDELTGDPAFRTNLRNMVNGLSGLVSSTQQLQQQAQLAQILVPLAAASSEAAARQPMAFPLPNPDKLSFYAPQSAFNPTGTQPGQPMVPPAP